MHDSLNNELSAIELELMWCFAFKKGIEFQKNLEQKTSEIDLSVRLAGSEM